MSVKIPEEAKNFKLLGHDASAAWGGGSIVEIHKGFAYVGAVGSASYNGPEGFTVHDVRAPRNPKKVAEVKSARAANRSRSASTTCRAPARTASASTTSASSRCCRTTRRAGTAA